MTTDTMTGTKAPFVMPKFDRAAIRARLAAALRDDSKAWHGAQGDYELSANLSLEEPVARPSRPPPSINTNLLPPTVFVQAAVLVALVERDGEFSVLLTERNKSLSKHAGQVAFPGGRMDPEDLSPEAGALREAWEETSLDPKKVEVLGRLRPWSTGTGYHITPVVGAVTPPLDLKPHLNEVTETFEVPLSFFLDAANHRRVAIDLEGMRRYFYEMPYGDRYIWGATAGMLMSLYYALTF